MPTDSRTCRPTTTSTQYEYTCSFAAAFCEGPGTIVKVWGDAQVLYDNSGSINGSLGSYTSSNWNTTGGLVLYQVGQIVQYDNGSTTRFYQCIAVYTGSLPFPNPSNGLYWSVYTGSVAVAGGQQYPSPTLYTGSDTQMPDPTIQAALGAAATSAFRGMVYCVWENLPLNGFGDRVPSIRGIVQTGTPITSPPTGSSTTAGVDYIVTDLCTRAGIPADVIDATDLAPIVTSIADIYQSDGSGIPLLTMLTGGVINFYQGPGCGVPFGFTYPNDGNNTPLPNPAFTYQMPSDMTFIMNPYPAEQDSTTEGYGTFLPGWTTQYSANTQPAVFVGVISGGGSGPATYDGTAIAPWVPGNVGSKSQANWNMSMNGTLQVAVAGNITFYCSSNSAVIIGIGNNASRVSGPMVNNQPGITPTKTPRSGYPIVFMQNLYMSELTASGTQLASTLSTFVVNFPKAGQYPIEIAYACHDGARCMCLNWNIGTEASPVQSPILPVNGTTGANPQAQAFGYAITEQKDGKSLIDDLRNAYFFDLAESDFEVVFVRRGVHPSVLTIPEADLGLFADGAEMETKTTQDQDQPRYVMVTYTDPSIDYQQGLQYCLRSSRVVTSLNKLTVDLPFVLTETLALQIAEITMYTAWMERKPYQMNLWRAYYALLDATDTVDFIYQGQPYQMRLTKTGIGQDYTLKFEGVSQTPGGYLSVSVGASPQGVVVSVLPAGGPSFVMLYDLPYLADSDASSDRSRTGFYWFLNGASVTWPGGVLLQSPTGTVYAQLGSQAASASYGYANAALADAPIFWTWDLTTTLSITMVRGSLAGASELDVLSSYTVNGLLIGNEFVQFVNAVQTGPNTYTISKLLRGRRNTEPFATGHAAPSGSPLQGELVVVLGGAVQRNDFSLSFIGTEEDYKAVSSGGDPTAVSAQDFTSAGHDLMPAAPVHPTFSRDGSNNLTIGWTRRTRYGGDWLESTPYVPLNEDSEAYQINVLSGGSVVRTISWTSGTYDGNGNPYATYSAADQTTDGFTPGNPITVNIMQISVEAGLGFPLNATG